MATSVVSVATAVVDATAGAWPVEGLAGGSLYEFPIGNLPLIAHVCQELAESGVTRTRMVAQPGIRRALGRIIGDGGAWGLEVSYVDVFAAAERQMVLEEVSRSLQGGAVLLHPGDCLLRDQLVAMTERYAIGDVDSVLAEQASGERTRGPGQLRASRAPLVLAPVTHALVTDLLFSEGDADLTAALVKSDYRLAVCAQTQGWCYSDSTDALLSANRMVLDSIRADPDRPELRETNRLDGRIVVGSEATISNSVICGPVSIADRAIVEDSYIGPYTAIANDAVVSGAEIDNSIVLAGAEIRHPGCRIEASIIGAGSRVTRSFGLPRGLHLQLPAGSRLTFS